MFSRLGTYPAVGLFSKTHKISIFVCFSLIAILVVFSRKMKSATYFKMLKVLAIVLTVLEVFRIGWEFYAGFILVESWLPLYFCSLFIYALWFTWSKNKFVKNLGLSYIALACIVAGSAFIIFPSTSFVWYPIFHFKCIYSMIFHSAMVYAGIMLYITKSYEVKLKSVGIYSMFCGIFMIIALIVNNIKGSNLMFLSRPGNIPIEILHIIYSFSPMLYTIVMLFAHIALMGFGVFGIVKLIQYFLKKRTQNVELEEDFEEKTT